MKNKEKIELSEDKEIEMKNAIKDYFSSERDEDLGDLASSLILDFVVEKLGPEFYNQGVYDSQKYMVDRCDDLLSIEIR